MKNRLLVNLIATLLILSSCGKSHVASNKFNYDETRHWNICADEGCSDHLFNIEDHDFEVSYVAPVVNTDGSKTSVCNVCGYSKTEVIKAVDSSDDFIEGGYDGILVEINAGRFIAMGSTYQCKFTPNTTNKAIRIENTNDKIIEVIHEGTSNSFSIKGLDVGDVALKIFDSEDMLVARFTVRVRESYSPDELARAVFDYDVYTSGQGQYDWLGDYRVNFVKSKPLTAVVKGKDEVDSNVYCECEFTYVEYYEPFDAYYYNVEMTQKINDKQKTDICAAYISVTADTVYLYYNPGDDSTALLTWVYPSILQSIRAM